MSLLARFRLEHARHNRQQGSPRPPSPARSQSLYFPRSSNSPPTSPGFPLAQPRRRERSISSDDLEAERQLKKRKLHALDTCRENQLDDSALDQFAEVSGAFYSFEPVNDDVHYYCTQLDLPQMLITLHGTLLALERERVKDDTQTFIRSPQFKVCQLLFGFSDV